VLPGVIRPILSSNLSVNQRVPSGPAVMTEGLANSLWVNSVTTPAGVIRPTRLPPVPRSSRLIAPTV
jgi:hypothetical protein